MNGKQLQIVTFVQGKLKFNTKNLRQVLKKCGERQLVIYSVAGKFREGKSFLLNLFLSFNDKRIPSTEWLDSSEEIKGKNNK